MGGSSPLVFFFSYAISVVMDNLSILPASALEGVGLSLDLIAIFDEGKYSELISVLKLISKSVDFQKQRKISRIISAVEGLRDALGGGNAPVLMGQTWNNLITKYGEETISELLYTAIVDADTSKRARLVGLLYGNSAKNKNVEDEFGSILHVIRSLEISDFEYLADARDSTIETNGNTERKKDLHINGKPQTFSTRKYMAHFTSPRLRRFLAAGLVKQTRLIEDDSIHFVDEDFTDLVIKATS